MLHPWTACLLLLVTGASALVCPYGGAGLYTGGTDGSCYSEFKTGRTRLDFYRDCAGSNAYLPFVMNAFQNTALQQNTQNRTDHGKALPGIWLGLTCTGYMATSCSWDDGTQLTSSSYSNFEDGFPNATIGPCVYQNATTGFWRSEACYPRLDIAGFCKFTPTNIAPMCSSGNGSIYPPGHKYEDVEYYFDGHCYSLYYAKNQAISPDIAEDICTQSCGHVVSIHSEGENSFVRDLLSCLKDDERATEPANGFLGIKSNSTQWLDGSALDYTNYATPFPPPGPCTYLATNSSQAPTGSWYKDICTPSHYLICKKPILNDCDAPYVPFPTDTPVTCTQPQYLGVSGLLRSPGYPYYPYGVQPNHCEYIQKIDDVLNPSITVINTILNNFPPSSNISHFDFYSSEDPNEKPFFTLKSSSPSNRITVTSSTNILRAVYSTVGNPDESWDWGELSYEAEQQLHCTFVMDYGFLGYYNQSAANTYSHENRMVQMTTSLLLDFYNTFSCQLRFSWNSAAYGNVGSFYSSPAPPYYTNEIPPYIPSTGGNSLDLCSAIDQLNSYTIPPGTENSCLVFFSGRSAQDFAGCRPVDTQKFKYTFGVAINAATGVSTFTSNIVNSTDFNPYQLMPVIAQTIRPTSCQ